MKHPLLFRFISPEIVEWHDQGSTQRATLPEFSALLIGRRPTLMAPGEAVNLYRVRIPGRNRATRNKALPYVLEDGLVDDVETLHFAVNDPSLNADTTVAVVAHTRLRAWLDACEEVGIELAAVVSEQLLLPYDGVAWSVYLESDRAVLRYGIGNGLACEYALFPILLRLAFQEAGEDAPRAVQLWGARRLEQQPELAELLQSLDIEVQLRDESDGGLHVFAAGAASGGGGFDLLQGVYSQSTQLGGWLKPWRSAAVLALLLLGLQGALQVSDYWRLRGEQADLNTQIEQVYRDAVPNARRIVNARAQLSNRLNALRGAQGQERAAFFELLNYGGQALSGFKEMTLRGLRYNDQRLELDLEGGSPRLLDRLREQFDTQKAVKAQIRSSQREGKIEARIILQRMAS